MDLFVDIGFIVFLTKSFELFLNVEIFFNKKIEVMKFDCDLPNPDKKKSHSKKQILNQKCFLNKSLTSYSNQKHISL